MKYWFKVSLYVISTFSLVSWSLFLAINYYLLSQSPKIFNVSDPKLKTFDIQGSEAIVSNDNIDKYIRKVISKSIEERFYLFFIPNDDLNVSNILNVLVNKAPRKNKKRQLKVEIWLKSGFLFSDDQPSWSKTIDYYEKIPLPSLKKTKIETNIISHLIDKNIDKQKEEGVADIFDNMNKKMIDKFDSFLFKQKENELFDLCATPDSSYIYDNYENKWKTTIRTETHFNIFRNSLISVSRTGTLQRKLCIPDYVKIIGPSAFKNCRLLKEIVFSKKLTTIGNNAFENCTSLEKVILTQNVKIIDDNAFIGCTSLKYVEISENVLQIGKNILDDNKQIVVVNNSLVLFDWWIKHHSYNNKTMAEMESINLNHYHNSKNQKFTLFDPAIKDYKKLVM